MTSKLIHSSTLVMALAAATLLAACGRDDAREHAGTTSGRTSGQQGESPSATNAGRAVDSANSAARDMAITAGVKTRLAADTRLSAMAINVDTSAGRVALRGTAPDTAARSHAAEVARSVEGVVDVDNALTVQASAN